MKTRNKKLIGTFLFIPILFGGIFFVLRDKAKTQTYIAITSTLPDSSSVGEKVRVEYKIISDVTDFTIIALPDTQHYSEAYPEIYLSQTQWIVENKDDLNIVFVTHLGDIVQHNDLISEEWVAADVAMSLLDDVVPYSVLPGNHDMQANGQADHYEEYFPASRYEDQSWWGGSFNGNKNNYQVFSAGGDDYVILHLQYCPTHEAIDWANQVLEKYPERKAIISTHVFLFYDGNRMSKCKDHSDGDVTPSQMWGRLIKNSSNVFMVLSGHIPGAARREDLQDRVIHQLLADYQDMDNGGNGYLRVMTFQPSSDIIRVTTYSPYLDEYLTDDENQFELSFDMTGGSLPMGEIVISNGTDECLGSAEEGSCELVLTTLGENNFTATYSGDANYRGSSSSEIPVFVESK